MVVPDLLGKCLAHGSQSSECRNLHLNMRDGSIKPWTTLPAAWASWTRLRLSSARWKPALRLLPASFTQPGSRVPPLIGLPSLSSITDSLLATCKAGSCSALLRGGLGRRRAWIGLQLAWG